MQAIVAGVRFSAIGAPLSTGRAGERRLASVEDADPQIPTSDPMRPVKLQHALVGSLNRDGHDGLLEHSELASPDTGDCTRLNNLQVKSCSFAWL